MHVREPAGVGRVLAIGLRANEESNRVAEFPVVHEMAVATSAFVAKPTGMHVVTFLDQLHEVFGFNLLAIDGFVAGVPHAKDHAAFGLRVDLHAEVAAMPTGRHVVGPQWIGLWG